MQRHLPPVSCRFVHPGLTLSGLRQYSDRLEGGFSDVSTADRDRTGARRRIGQDVARAAVPLTLFILFILSGVALPACTSQNQTTTDTAPQELSIGYVSAGNLDELRRTLTTESLVYTRADGEFQPGLAEDWSISDDGLTVTLTLLADAAFHDGVPLNAEIVKTLLDAARLDPRRQQDNPALADIDAIDTVGQNIVRLHYRRGTYLRLEGLSERVDRQVDGTPVGTGPFVLQDQTRDAMTLTASSEYRRGRPAIDVVHVETFATVRTA